VNGRKRGVKRREGKRRKESSGNPQRMEWMVTC